MASTGYQGYMSISATRPASYNNTGFTALTFTKLDNLLSGAVNSGTEWGSTTDTYMETAETFESKTSRNIQKFTLTFLADETNAGLTILDAASVSQNYYAFEQVNGAGQTKYFEAKVMSKKYTDGDTGSHEKVMYDISVRALDPIFVAAP